MSEKAIPAPPSETLAWARAPVSHVVWVVACISCPGHSVLQGSLGSLSLVTLLDSAAGVWDTQSATYKNQTVIFPITAWPEIPQTLSKMKKEKDPANILV